ncbi:MAG: hypothetical protein ACYDEQ_03020 [Desulfocucumaceae bacterium]
MDQNMAAYLVRGWIGGFVAVYAVYYILTRFVFVKLEVVRASRISLALSFVLLIMVSDYSIPEALLFFTPGVVNVLIIETLLHSRRFCPSCKGRIKKDAKVCRHCDWVLIKEDG